MDQQASGRRTPPVIMGILNVTPDSFSDGGLYLDPASAVARGCEMLAAGAGIIDIGGESTRPGAAPVPAAEQIRRVEPVIAGLLAAYPDALLSVDTQSAGVAAAALAAGARLVNDVSALRGHPDMAAVIREAGAGVILMHMQGEPRTMQHDPQYGDVVRDVATFLESRRDFAIQEGIAPEGIVLDPGIGFGKCLEHNLRLLANLPRLTALGPVLLGTSRKSFLGKLLGLDDPRHRGGPTEITHALAIRAGVRFLRVHDVPAARRTIALVMAIEAAGGD